MKRTALVLAALALPFAALPLASAVTPTEPASVNLVATLSPPLPGSAIGTAVTVPLGGGTVLPVTITATCTTSEGACPSDTTYAWSSSVGTTTETSPGQASFDPGFNIGTHTVSVAVASPGQVSGSASMQVVVANPFVDSVEPDALTATAANLLDSCGPYTNLPGDDSYSSSEVGQLAFCPEPNGSSSGSFFPTNGIDLSAQCLLDPTACGANPQIASAVANTANPPVCTSPACESRMRLSKLVSPENLRAYSPTICVDNLKTNTLFASGGEATQTLRGTERGCATREDAARAVLALAPENLSVQLPPPSVPTPNLVLNPTVDSSTDDWFFGDSSASLEVPTGGSSSAVKVDNEDFDQFVVALADGVVPGQTYTASAFIRSPGNAGNPVSISIASFDAAGELVDPDLTDPSTSTWLTDGPQYTRVNVTGVALTDQVGVRIDVPSVNKNVFIDDVVLTSSNELLPFSLDPVLTYCPSGPEPSQTVLRAAAINPAVELCDSDAALTKSYAAATLSWVLSDNPTTGSTTSTDFSDVSASQAAAFSNLFTYGVPVPGSLRCPNNYSSDVCLNPEDALTRAQFSQMLAPLIDAANLSVTPATLTVQAPTTVPGASTVPVSVRSIIPAGSNGSYTLSASGEGFCPVPAVSLTATTTAVTTCFLTAAAVDADSTSTFTLTDSDGNVVASTDLSLPVSNTRALVPSLYLPSSEKGGEVSTFAFIVDLEADTAAVGVRSCDPATETCPTGGATFPQTGEDRVLTDDSNPSSFVKSATTEIGSVSLSDPADGKAVLVYTPFEDTTSPVPGTYVNGDWAFVLQSCDSEDNCKSTLVENFRTPVPDAPVAPDTDLTTTVSSASAFVLTPGSDLYDEGRAPGTTSDPVTVSFSALPLEGSLTVTANASPVVVGNDYPVATSFTYTAGVNPGVFTATYSYTDSDDPALTSIPASLTITVS